MQPNHHVIVDIGGVAVRLTCADRALAPILERRFGRFLNPSARPAFEFEITLITNQDDLDGDEDLRVETANGRWIAKRGDFHAEWSVAERTGRIWQTPNPYAIDSILRVVHTLVLASEGEGFLLHASSAVRDGRAYVFTGPSGAGKSTIVRLAPGDVTILTDEISYIRKARDGAGYTAFGTPFAGELSDVGAPVNAPVEALFRLGRGDDNRHERLDAPRAVRTLMRNILFFADDRTLVGRVFDTAVDFVRRIPAFELKFAPDARVWSTLQ